jgi:hypothetical protein
MVFPWVRPNLSLNLVRVKLVFVPAKNDQCNSAAEPQHFFNFFPLPQGQGSLRPTLVRKRWDVSRS